MCFLVSKGRKTFASVDGDKIAPKGGYSTPSSRSDGGDKIASSGEPDDGDLCFSFRKRRTIPWKSHFNSQNLKLAGPDCLSIAASDHASTTSTNKKLFAAR